LPILLIFLSIPAQPGPAAEFLLLPHFSAEEIRAEREYSQVRIITQAKIGEKSGKNEDFYRRLWIFRPKTAVLPLLFPPILPQS
jgi:hypothetical protein